MSKACDIRVKNFGCRLNSYEGGLIQTQLESSSQQDCVVINSCAVTAEAEKQVRKEIRRSRKAYPHHKIIVTGCASHIDPESYAAMPEVDAVVGNDVKTSKDSYNFLDVKKTSLKTSTENFAHDIQAPKNRVRAVLEIQNGCDHRCSFCVIPFGRGDSRSLPVADALRHAESLSQQGVKEIVLSGVDMTAYGCEWNDEGVSTLGHLLRRLCTHLPDMRWRLSSLDGVELDADFLQSFADFPQIQPYIHLSLQSGNDLILKRMKRRHSRQDSLDIMQNLRQARSDVVFGGDFICGFPTEDDSMFEDSLSLILESGMVWLHVFPYSARPHTPAARIPKQVPMEIRKARVAKMQKLGQAQVKNYLQSLLGSEQEILAHHDGTAYSPTYAPIKLAGDFIGGEIYKVKLHKYETSQNSTILLAS